MHCRDGADVWTMRSAWGRAREKLDVWDAVRISVSGGFHVSGLRSKEIARRQVECWGRSAEASHPGPVAARVRAWCVWVGRGVGAVVVWLSDRLYWRGCADVMAFECTSSGEDGGVVYCSGCMRAALEVAIGLTTGPQCIMSPVVAEALCRAVAGLA